MTERLNHQLKFLEIADSMKQIFRQTMLIDGSRYENDAEHSWHFALTAMMLPLKTAIPSLWQWVEDAIKANVEKGLLIG